MAIGGGESALAGTAGVWPIAAAPQPRFARSRRSHDDPALTLSLDNGVLDQRKAEPVDVKVDGFVVVANEDGYLTNGLLHERCSDYRAGG
jgi:hypothetical protein